MKRLSPSGFWSIAGLIFVLSAADADTKVTDQNGIQFFGSVRLRVEDWNWFPTDKANGAYNFVGGQFRVGAQRSTKSEDMFLELEAPILWNLPSQAIATAPQGQLGMGGSYYASMHDQNFGFFVKQGYVRLKGRTKNDPSLRLGRFEFSDGSEVAISDPSVNYLVQNRISQRLIGPFGFTHVGRSFDGGQVTQVVNHVSLTGLVAFPTKGAFSLQGMDTLSHVQFGYISGSVPNVNAEKAELTRGFAAYYNDGRKGVLKTDNRPATVRTADTSNISIETLGASYVGSKKIGSGKGDLVLWGAGQTGTWGNQRQQAYAYALESGYQWKNVAMKPWLRMGYFTASGDSQTGDNTHNTFFPMLPSARNYARFPFYAEANLKDLMGQIILKPSSKWTVRWDYHDLQLADSHDLWYSGSGAFDNMNFGYSGRPSGGRSDLAKLIDLSVDYQVNKTTTITFYSSYARGGSVVRNSFKSPDSTLNYIELQKKF